MNKIKLKDLMLKLRFSIRKISPNFYKLLNSDQEEPIKLNKI